MDHFEGAEHAGTELEVDGLTSDNGSPDIDGEKDFEFDFDGQIMACTSHDSDNDISDKMVLENHTVDLNTIENSEPIANSDATKMPELDKPEAVWVKWRGQWQSGIRCARADWPLPTLRAKPTHGRKKYVVIFFPRTRNYSWADVLLVRPITDFPEPIAYKTYKVGANMVRDLTLARRFIIQKLAVTVLNILDQLHHEALVETSRDATVMKDFSVEASRCKDYSDLGRILLKLQSMILQQYFAPHWLEHSMQAWKQRCRDADSAESVEILKEELADSILWNQVNVLSNKATSADFTSEWRSWKHDVMKLFSVSHPSGNFVPEGNNSPPTTDVQMSASKRPKLEIRRADTAMSSHNSTPVQTVYSPIVDACDAPNKTSIDSESHKTDMVMDDGNKWDSIVVEPGNSSAVQSNDSQQTPIFITQDQKSVRGLGNRNRQCQAFIESKGRQCVRFANEGDVYCCVHLSNRYVGSAAKTEPFPQADSPMCGGTTVLGTKCKHRALIGSLFCKKHMPHDGGKGNVVTSSSLSNNLKRKMEEAYTHADYYVGAENEVVPQMDPLIRIGNASTVQELESVAMVNPHESQEGVGNDETAQCIGSWPQGGEEPCNEIARRHSLYCDKHIPNWLKRARNGKSRIVSKDVFLELLGYCQSREEKLQLHQACELFYRLFKSILSLRNPASKEAQFQWAIGEASKDVKVGEFLMKLVHSEKGKLEQLWSFGDSEKNSQEFSPAEELAIVAPIRAYDEAKGGENVIKCKICSANFTDNQTLGAHWSDSHKKEAQWLFRGYVCAICFDSFTNKKVLELHVQERHHSQFVEHCVLLQCISCNSNFGNTDELWSHVISMHPSDLRQANVPQNQVVEGQLNGVVVEPNNNKTALEESSSKLENQSSVNRRFICRFCGLKFDLLPDLGRHHQAAHMGMESTTSRLKKSGIQLYPQKLKSGRLTHPRFKLGLNSASYKKIKNRSMLNLKKRYQTTNSLTPVAVVKSSVPEPSASLGRVAESQCSAIAKILSSEIKRTKPQPSHSEILAIATQTCCKASLTASLQLKYGTLPERIYLRAAKLCSEHNVSIRWHQEGFVCPKGCALTLTQQVLSPIIPSPDYVLKARATASLQPRTCGEWTMDESHCVIDSRYFSMDLSGVVLCDDVSFGQESVPIACVVDENLLNAEGADGQMAEFSFPWESFTYVTKSLVDPSPSLESENSQLQCGCAQATCLPRTCDHVYLFDNDFEGAKDIYGEPMRGRFPYDERGRIILEEGYLVYECNQRCSCSKFCRNRVLQNGVKLKLEIFKTEKKGWAVRAREAILRGTFVCEYIGEIIDENEANERRNNRHGEKGCHYFFEVDAHINDMSRLIEGQPTYVIDATDYGNVSRYINHSCSPNLANHQVLVESMDSKLAHIGFYANRDITPGEELTYDFRYKLLPGEGIPCLCGASNCRGGLY